MGNEVKSRIMNFLLSHMHRQTESIMESADCLKTSKNIFLVFFLKMEICCAIYHICDLSVIIDSLKTFFFNSTHYL